MPQPTKEDVYRDLRRLADELGRTPNTADIDEHSAFTVEFVHRKCGGVPTAQVAAELPPTSTNGLSEDDLLNEVKRVADDLGRMPKRTEFDERSYIMSRSIKDKLGISWQEIAEELGFEPVRRHKLTREAVVEDLRRLGEELGRRPEKREAIEHGQYSEWAYTRKFAPYSELVEEAGFVGRPREYDFDDPEFAAAVEADVRRVADELGRKPMVEDMMEHGEYTEWVYKQIHGSWNNLLEAAGFERTPNPLTGETSKSDE